MPQPLAQSDIHIGQAPSRQRGRALNGERCIRRGVRFGLSNGDPSAESRPTGDSEYGESTRAPAVGVSASPALKRNIFFAGLHAPQRT
jgi:hypothetical protein